MQDPRLRMLEQHLPRHAGNALRRRIEEKRKAKHDKSQEAEQEKYGKPAEFPAENSNLEDALNERPDETYQHEPLPLLPSEQRIKRPGPTASKAGSPPPKADDEELLHRKRK